MRELDEVTGAGANGEGPAGIIPFASGFNASLVSASQHDAGAGWSSVLTPNVAWRINRHFSINAQVPVYTYINVSIPTSEVKVSGVVTQINYTLETKKFQVGDTTIAAQFELHPRLFDYILTATLGTPTGNFPYGLGSGQYTYNINNHFEHPFAGFIVPEAELGIGDSSSLINSRVRQSFVAVGEQAHFQAGLTLWLPWHGINFRSNAYEDMPLSTQTVTNVTISSKKGVVKVVKSTHQESVGEDNGFLNTLDIPLTSHVILSGFYNRSLVNKDDIAGFSFAFILRRQGADTKVH